MRGRRKKKSLQIGPVLLKKKKKGLRAAMGALRFWYPNHAAVLYSSMHMGRLTNVKTLYSIMTEKQRKMAYKTRT